MNKTIGLLAHVDAGKTTFAEALLYRTRAIRSRGRVDHRNAFLDGHEIEKARGITVFADQAEMTYGNSVYFLLDTPGHVDFSAEMERALQVLDYAVIIVSAVEGVEGRGAFAARADGAKQRRRVRERMTSRRTGGGLSEPDRPACAGAGAPRALDRYAAHGRADHTDYRPFA